MARIHGDHVGTTFDDFLVLPGLPGDDSLIPDHVTLKSSISGIKLEMPFFTAAMRSVTGKELAFKAGKLGMMAVAPRGLSIEKQAEIVRYVKEREVKPGEIESLTNPAIAYDNAKLGDTIKTAKESGHSKIPIITKKSDFIGMFVYNPSEHDRMNIETPITKVMLPFKDAEGNILTEVCKEGMSDNEIKNKMNEKNFRYLPILDDMGRLSRLVFIQKDEAYKIGAAIDTHPGWESRARTLILAGADMIFIDTSDGHKAFTVSVVKKFKELFPKTPICAGNIVTPEAFEYLADAGADAIKVGMGPGSICTTNEVLGIGSPPFWALVEVCSKRDQYANERGKYIPVIVDGGIESTSNMTVALTHADGLMGGKIFGCFDESAGDKIKRNNKIVGVRLYGEASQEAFETTGDMKRYSLPNSEENITSFQGVSGIVPFRGRFKPGVEMYIKTLKEALFHTGSKDLKEYREKAVLVRMSERAKQTAKPHGLDVIGD
ncbi:MAG: IMP dehydrogenase [Nanoarchaeota archaeon]